MNQQFTDKALGKFEEAHKLDPSSAIPVLNKGIALIYLRRLPEAEAALKEATALDPKNVRAWYSLGITHFAGDRNTQAIDDFKRAIAIDQGDADSYYYLGSLYLKLKDYSNAIPQFETALKLNPLHASAQFGLASALQRSGKVDEAREHFKRFQKIVQSKIGAALTINYGEQGHNATVLDMLAPPEPVGPMIPVQFIASSMSGAKSVPAPEGGLGGGLCVLDVDGKGAKEIVAAGDGDAALRLYRFNAQGSLEEIPSQSAGLSLTGHAVACAVGDYDNDGLPDLAVSMSDRVVLFHNLGHGKFADATKAAGLGQFNRPAGLTFVDFDHDGDLDLFITGARSATSKTPNVLWRNNGDSTFTEWTGQTGLGGSGETLGAMLSDINNDRAVDLLVTGDAASPTVYENQREGAFKAVSLYDGSGPGATRGAYIFDFNKDGWMDVALTHRGAPGISLWRNVGGSHFERVTLPANGITSAWGLTAIDVDNDGWIDLAAIVETTSGPQLRVWRNRGADGFEDVSSAVGANKLSLSNPRSIIAADVNGDGAADLIVSRLHAAPIVLLNAGGSRNHSLRISLTGLADNKTAIGTKVDVFSNGHVQKFEVAGGSGYLGQGSNEIIAGLGKAATADVVRLLWPTGVPQDELDLAASKPAALQELDRRGSSCPVLFAWNGSKYQFISDVIGAGVVGHWISPTSTNKSDPDEWIKVDGSALKERRGYLSVRFGEPMEEINYIDQLRMVAIDHPADTEVYPDERFLDNPPFASGSAVVATPQAHGLNGAWDDQGRDVLRLLAAQDHQYVRDFTNLKYAGYANMHTLTLDLGDWSSNKPLRLFMRGFIEYFSASSMYAAWQAGLQPVSPYVEAQMPDGSWKRIVEDMGFPAGLPRTIVVDLTGKLPQGVRRIRIKTNLQIYWDQVLVDNGPEMAQQVRQTELPLASAHLDFRGYPQQVDGETPGDLTYRYDRISKTGPFQWQRGEYTRYGDVTPLLKQVDNHYVVFGSGEDVDAEFSDASLPPLPKGWKRDYFFYANGFVKDMDFYEAMPFTVAEMPFHEMSAYPYASSEHYPEDGRSVRYQLDWNDRFESGNRTQRYQFHYLPTPSEPITPDQASGGAR
ncbi:FG-GAP-like repeat-containing protein [Silvibacterium acidisoli]|uniref:FG-GAP-like repeat-containing protein n=1 Tax=Acidobacteriaceae bacterium ZG23-2 TaxID=2883246 RepID=UPI00406C38FA